MSSSVAARPSSNSRIPLHFYKLISYADWADTVIGSVKKGLSTHNIIVKVNTSFNGGATLDIGDDDDNSNLLVNTEISLLQVGHYIINSNVNYDAIVNLKAYVSGTPTVGSLEIFIFYQ